jgi:hypothetical protein
MRSGGPVALLVVGALALLAAAPARGDDGDQGRLEGVVMDAGGAPAAGATVILAGHGVHRDTPADAGGRFRIGPIDPGVYLLSATLGSIASSEIRVEVREGEAPALVTLLLRPPLPVLDVFASMPVAGRLEVFLAGENLLDDRSETGRAPVVTLGAPRTVTAGVRPAWSPAP